MKTEEHHLGAPTPLRIAMMMAGHGSGGMEKHTLELCAELARMGHSVSLLAHPCFAVKVSPAVRFIAVDLARHRLDLRLLFHSWRHLRRLRPQVIHAQANKAAAIISMVRGWLPEPVRVATIHNQKRQMSMFRSFDARIAVSKQTARLLEPLPTAIIYNGIEPAPPPTRDTSAWDGLRPGTRVLAVGRLVPAKAFDNLLLAWRNIKASLVIAGSGALHDALQSQIERSGLGDRVRLLGHRDDIATLMYSAELLVVSSRNEGGPYVVVEALQAKLPVVSTRVGIVPEILPKHACCPSGDAASLEHSVSSALSDLPRFRESLEPAFSQAASEMTLSGMARKTVEVYRSALRDIEDAR